MQQYHASAVAYQGRGVLILGESKTGKSTLAVNLMAMGCQLVGDDQVFVGKEGAHLWVHSHPNAQGLFEIRNLGIFKALTECKAKLVLAIDLNQDSVQRLPDQLWFSYDSVKLPSFNGKGLPHLADFIYLYLSEQIEIADV